MITYLVFLIVSLFVVIKGADLAIKYSTKIAHNLHVSPYIIGFMVVAVFSIMPEAFISLVSSLENNPSFGLGVIYGSNIADLTLIIALVALFKRSDIKVKSEIIKERFSYVFIVLIPILLGLNGHYGRIEGLVLILSGILFYIFVLRENKKEYSRVEVRKNFDYKNLAMLALGIIVLIFGSHFTVENGVKFAEALKINPIIIGMFIVGLGTTLPELTFSIRAVKKNEDSLALGDILGTVVADVTIVVGLMALLNPFYFNPRIVYVTGISMVLAMILIGHFMKTERTITQRETVLLLLFYLLFCFIEFLTNSLY